MDRKEQDRYRGTKFGTWTLVELISWGGFGCVWYAGRWTGKRIQHAAIKFPLPHLLADPTRRERIRSLFADESSLLVSLENPYIVNGYEYSETPDGLPFLVMEFLEGASLATLLRGPSDMPEPLVCYAGYCMASGLHRMHTGYDIISRDGDGRPEPLRITHRDISAENAFATRHGHVKLCDLGIADFAERTTAATTVALTDKPLYRSPTIFKLVHRLQEATERGDEEGVKAVQAEINTETRKPSYDGYLLGETMFRLASGGALPYADSEARITGKLRPLGATVHPQLAELIRSFLSLDEAARPSMAEASTVLLELANGASAPQMEQWVGTQLQAFDEHSNVRSLLSVPAEERPFLLHRSRAWSVLSKDENKPPPPLTTADSSSVTSTGFTGVEPDMDEIVFATGELVDETPEATASEVPGALPAPAPPRAGRGAPLQFAAVGVLATVAAGLVLAVTLDVTGSGPAVIESAPRADNRPASSVVSSAPPAAPPSPSTQATEAPRRTSSSTRPPAPVRKPSAPVAAVEALTTPPTPKRALAHRHQHKKTSQPKQLCNVLIVDREHWSDRAFVDGKLAKSLKDPARLGQHISRTTPGRHKLRLVWGDKVGESKTRNITVTASCEPIVLRKSKPS